MSHLQDFTKPLVKRSNEGRFMHLI